MGRGVSVVAFIVAVVIGSLPVGDAEAGRRRRPKAGAALSVDDLKWPQSTRSARAKLAAKIYRKAAGRETIGKLAKGTRVGWTRIVAARGRCKAWLEIEPRGWVCDRDLTPSDDEPKPGTDSWKIVQQVAAKKYSGVDPSGAEAYDTLGAVRRGRATRKLDGWTFLRKVSGTVTVGGVLFHRTNRGWIAASKVVPRQASDFEGVDLTTSAPGWPFGWVVPHQRDALVAVRVAPDRTAEKVRELARRDLVPVLEIQDGYARIGEHQWVSVLALRIARPSQRPTGIRADERWIDVDLDQQVLVAYDGDTPVYATMVSTGQGKSTPTGIHRIEKKLAKTRMRNPEDSLGTWDVPDVPFSMRFRKNYAVHGVYWHDSFGKKRSHGCVNLSPRDARHLFEWTFPQVPDGWLQADARSDEGTPIRLRNRKDPDPMWTDYDAPSPVKRREPEET